MYGPYSTDTVTAERRKESIAHNPISNALQDLQVPRSFYRTSHKKVYSGDYYGENYTIGCISPRDTEDGLAPAITHKRSFENKKQSNVPRTLIGLHTNESKNAHRDDSAGTLGEYKGSHGAQHQDRAGTHIGSTNRESGESKALREVRNSTELAEAINSMFRWYQDATKCYVYLPDVSRPRTDSADGSNEDWVSIFRKSEWFRRGWTLQELIAPASVDFFCKEGELLGSKASLERHICE
ncbi:hypothetical protein IFR05_017187, partial [Cadophora sp. M221]